MIFLKSKTASHNGEKTKTKELVQAEIKTQKANLARTARPGWEAALPRREDSKETETASTPSFVTAGSKIL